MDSPPHNLTSHRLLGPALALLLLVLTLVATAPLFTGPAEFIADDYYFIADNPRVTSFTLDSFRQIWLTPMRIEYFPVTITSYALEFALWGNSVKLYRMTNVLLFWGIGIVAWSLAVQIARRRNLDGPAVRVAAFLAMAVMLLHPVNVESVAGISHRKELLYVLFGLLSLRLYTVPQRGLGATMGALLFMGLGQLSKGSGVVLPLLLLLAEFVAGDASRPVRTRLRNLLPFFGTAAAIFAVQFSVASHAGVVASEGGASLVGRMGGIIRTFNVMLTTIVWPRNLVFDYDIPWPAGLPPVAEMILPGAVVGGLGFLAWKRRFGPLAAVLLVLAPLAPYLQIVPLAHNLKGQLVFYDHYLLFSTVLAAIPLTWLLLRVVQRRAVLVGLPALLALFWAGFDHYLAGFWKTRETLYRRVVSLSPSLPKGHLFLGRAYLEAERYDEAKRELTAVFASKQWNPTFAEVYQALGDAHAFSGNYPEAERNYRSYLALKPDDLKSLQNLSTSLIQMGRLPEAREVLLQLLRYYPQDPIGLNNMGLVAGRTR